MNLLAEMTATIGILDNNRSIDSEHLQKHKSSPKNGQNFRIIPCSIFQPNRTPYILLYRKWPISISSNAEIRIIKWTSNRRAATITYTHAHHMPKRTLPHTT